MRVITHSGNLVTEKTTLLIKQHLNFLLLALLFTVLTVTASAQPALKSYQYEGQTDSNGRPEGQGVMTWDDAKFEGTFHNGEPTEGIFITYENGKKIKKSTGSFTTKSHREGQLQSSDVLEHGWAEKIVLGENGLVYRGQYKDGLAEGYGECFFFDNPRLMISNWYNNYTKDYTRRIEKNRTYRGYTDTGGEWKYGAYYSRFPEEENKWEEYYQYYLYCKTSGFQDWPDDPKNEGTAGYSALQKLIAALQPEAVDLGLSVKWADRNLGASTPDFGQGHYFAWAETSPKSEYSWRTLKYCTSTEGEHFSKYNKWDNKTSLDLSDDAARANWGGNWRTPTSAELAELIDKCEWSWMERDLESGYQVTGPNGRSIFLPAASHMSYGDSFYVGARGYYWSSSRDTYGSRKAMILYFNSTRSSLCLESQKRAFGFSVRPVTE